MPRPSVVDGRRIFVGSLNFDPRSSALNTEMGLVVDSPTLTQALATFFGQLSPQYAFALQLSPQGSVQWLDGTKPVLDEEPQTSLGRRIWVQFLSWLPIDWLL